MKRKGKGQAAFSLVEVVFALAVSVFCLLPILGLMAIGLTANQDTIRNTTAASLAEAITDDLRSTPTTSTNSLSPHYGLTVPAPGASQVTNTIYLTQDANIPSPPTKPSTTQATYLATVVLTPAGLETLNVATARILITWPALPNQAVGTVPTVYRGSFETVIGLAQN